MVLVQPQTRIWGGWILRKHMGREWERVVVTFSEEKQGKEEWMVSGMHCVMQILFLVSPQNLY